MKVGDYVRTKDGLIGKYNIKKEYHTIPMWQGGSKYQEVEQQYINDIKYNKFDYEIIKSSPNIIDLIEEDDFINQTRVSEIIKKTKDSIRFMADSDYEFSTELKEEEIETILTKEQFESMEYKVGE